MCRCKFLSLACLMLLASCVGRPIAGEPAGPLSGTVVKTDPFILNVLFDLFNNSDRNRPDLSKSEGTLFADLLKVGSPDGYVLRNRYLNPGVTLVEALAQDPDPALRDKLVEFARWHRSTEVRSTALVALARFRDERDFDIFREALGHLDPAIRFGAIEAIMIWGHPEKSQAILKAVSQKDTQPIIRVFAVMGLTRMGAPAGLSELRGFLESQDWLVRAMAARYLGDLGEAQDYDTLADRIDREHGNDFVMAEYCIAALKLFPKKKP